MCRLDFGLRVCPHSTERLHRRLAGELVSRWGAVDLQRKRSRVVWALEVGFGRWSRAGMYNQWSERPARTVASGIGHLRSWSHRRDRFATGT